MNRFQKYLANNIKMVRNQRKLTQMQLAELCETSVNYIGLIETEKRFPSAEMLEKIANALDMRPQEMFAEQTISYVSNDRKDQIIEEIVKILNKEI